MWSMLDPSWRWVKKWNCMKWAHGNSCCVPLSACNSCAFLPNPVSPGLASLSELLLVQNWEQSPSAWHARHWADICWKTEWRWTPSQLLLNCSDGVMMVLSTSCKDSYFQKALQLEDHQLTGFALSNAFLSFLFPLYPSRSTSWNTRVREHCHLLVENIQEFSY